MTGYAFEENDAGGIDEKYLDPHFGAELLAALPIFKDFSEDERARIYGTGDVRLFKNTSNIIIEGEQSVGLYIILQGSVGIYKSGSSGRAEHRLATLSVGKSFGEMSFIDKKPRSATVVAEGLVVAFYLDGEIWMRVLEEDPHTASRFYSSFAQVLASRLRELDEQFILSQKQLWKFALARTAS